jgi:hypothetical protein
MAGSDFLLIGIYGLGTVSRDKCGRGIRLVWFGRLDEGGTMFEGGLAMCDKPLIEVAIFMLRTYSIPWDFRVVAAI